MNLRIYVPMFLIYLCACTFGSGAGPNATVADTIAGTGDGDTVYDSGSSDDAAADETGNPDSATSQSGGGEGGGSDAADDESGSDSDSDSSGEPEAVCMNGLTEGDEECDDNDDIDDDECTNACTNPVCGDEIVQILIGEVCDDGNSVITDSCVACAEATCGDGFVWENVEACDDGDNDDTDGCTSSCNEVCPGVATLIENEDCRIALHETDGCCDEATIWVDYPVEAACVYACILAGIIPVFDCAPVCALEVDITPEDAATASGGVNGFLSCVNNEPICTGVEIVPVAA